VFLCVFVCDMFDYLLCAINNPTHTLLSGIYMYGCTPLVKTSLKTRKRPPYRLTFTPKPTQLQLSSTLSKQSRLRVKVAIIRSEGSNGDREMAAAFVRAGFETWDVHMSDLMWYVLWFMTNGVICDM